ncbi:MAG: DUF599 domain-containing protein [Pseudomonadota bacterium]
MDVFAPLSGFHLLDAAAVVFLFLCWTLIGWQIERTGARRKSVSVLMAQYRREWMTHVPERDPRVFDALLTTNLRDGTAFLASACLIAIGGATALLTNTEQVGAITADLTQDTAPEIVLEIKLLIVVLLVTNAFLKFVWANRVFGYCVVMMGTIPNDPEDARTPLRIHQAAELNVSAARAFNQGLRSIYFSLGALAWLIGAVALIIATLVVLCVIIRREYISNSRAVLAKDPAL